MCRKDKTGKLKVGLGGNVAEKKKTGCSKLDEQTQSLDNKSQTGQLSQTGDKFRLDKSQTGLKVRL